MRIGILGGSFDPIHKGHLALARESEKQFQLDKILFIPASIPPHKKEDLNLSPAPLRARMVELAIGGEPRWELCDIEFRALGPAYTVETLRKLGKIYPKPHQLFFIAGADSYHGLQTWREPEEILRLSEWIVAPRPLFDLPRALPPGFHLLRISPINLSASELRAKIARGEKVSDEIPARVYEFIRSMKLYTKEKK